MNFNHISTAPQKTRIFLAKWSEEDQLWEWVASGMIYPGSVWIDAEANLFYTPHWHEPSHWAPMTEIPKP